MHLLTINLIITLDLPTFIIETDLIVKTQNYTNSINDQKERVRSKASRLKKYLQNSIRIID